MSTFEYFYPPITPVENKIKLLLVLQGYDRRNIQFRNQGGIDGRYLRYGYWEDIGHRDIDYVNEHMSDYYTKLELFELYDDDCGWLRSYNIKEEE